MPLSDVVAGPISVEVLRECLPMGPGDQRRMPLGEAPFAQHLYFQGQLAAPAAQRLTKVPVTATQRRSLCILSPPFAVC
jgi:hypothetical protein